MDQDMRNRVNFLEGEVTMLEIIVAEMVAAAVSNRLVDVDLLKVTLDDRIASSTIRQYDDLVVRTLGEHYFRVAVQVLDKVKNGLPGIDPDSLPARMQTNESSHM